MERPGISRESSRKTIPSCTAVELAVVVALLCAFASLASSVVGNRALSFDQPVMQAIRHFESSWLTLVMQVVTASASVLGTTLLALALCICWWQAGRRSEAIALALGLAVSAALGQALKHVFARPRPRVLPLLSAADGWSFPSGHTLNAVTLAGLLAWLIGRRLGGWRRVAFDVVVGLWAVLIGLSRVYLGVHYPSDVLASLAAGGLFLLAGRGIARLIHPDRQDKEGRP
jgi:undecaprenyl-diphosphatase